MLELIVASTDATAAPGPEARDPTALTALLAVVVTA